MHTEPGTVRWFDESKGYGFITRADQSDVFVHHSAIQMDGFKTLSEGQVINMVVDEKAERGPLAKTVEI